MKLTKKSAVCGILLALLVTASCSKKDTQHDGVMFMPVKYDGKVAYMNAEGRFFLENDQSSYLNRDLVTIDGEVFKDVAYMASFGPYATLNCFFGGQKYIVDVEKDKLLFRLPESSQAGTPNNGVLPIVKPDQPIKIYDVKGRQLFNLFEIEGKEVLECDAFFNDGLLRFKTTENKYGFVDTKGNCVITPEFDAATIFYKGHALLKKDNKVAIYDVTGTKVTDVPQDMAYDFRKPCYVPFGYPAWDPSFNLHLITFDGTNTLLNNGFAVVESCSENYIVIGDEKHRNAVKDYSGNTLIEFSNDSYAAVDNNTLLKYNASTNRFSLVDPHGNQKAGLDEWKSVATFGPVHGYTSNFGLVGKKNGESYYLNKEGKQVHDYPVNINLTLMDNPIKPDTVAAGRVLDTLLSNMNAQGIGDYSIGKRQPSTGHYYEKVENPLNLPYKNLISYTLRSDGTIEEVIFSIKLNKTILKHPSAFRESLENEMKNRGWLGYQQTCRSHIETSSDVLKIQWDYLPECMRRNN